MQKIFFSCFGTTDPVRGMRDGGMLHILRFYRPEAVYLFLSREIAELDRADQRIEKTFAYLQENWDGYCPEVIRQETDISDPSDMDILLEPMQALFQRAATEHPEVEILINLSSGTPQMQVILAQLALDSRYHCRGIQVKNPERASGRAERTNSGRYPVDEALGLNDDEEPDAPNRCCEPRLLAVRREAVRSRLNGLLAQRNYAAIAQMGGELPAPIPKLARHLDYRSHFQLKQAEQEAAGLTGLKLQAGRGSYPYPVYELLEYFAVLKNLVYLKRYTDFMLRLNPFLVRLQRILLDAAAKPSGLSAKDLITTADGRERVIPEHIRSICPDLYAFMLDAFGAPLEARDISIRGLNVMLRFFRADAETLELLDGCERGNQVLRNRAAHTLFAITAEDIRRECGISAEILVQRLEKVLEGALSDYPDPNRKRRINIYDFCDRLIRDCL